MSNDSTAGNIALQHQAIMAARRRGVLTDSRALHWARRAARGEDVRVTLASLDGSAGPRTEASPDLAAQVLNELIAAFDQQPVMAARPFAIQVPPGPLRAHSNAQAANTAHQATSQAFDQGDDADAEFAAEFAGLYPQAPGSAGHRVTPPRRASAAREPLNDDELYRALFGDD